MADLPVCYLYGLLVQMAPFAVMLSLWVWSLVMQQLEHVTVHHQNLWAQATGWMGRRKRVGAGKQVEWVRGRVE